MSKTKIGKTIIALNDSKIQYLTLAKNDYGYYIKNYDIAKLEEGVIKNGEILKADFLKKVLQKIVKKIGMHDVHLLLPHDYFLFDRHIIPKEKKTNTKKLVKNYIKDSKEHISWIWSHAYEYDIFEEKKSVKVLFRALPLEIYSSYKYVFEQAGLNISSVQSEIVSFSFLLKNTARVSEILFTEDITYVLEYKNGIFMSDKKFNLSYKQLIQDIQKNINITETEAKKILNNYGVMFSHSDKKVLARIERSMGPLFDFILHRKIKEKSSLYIHFSDTPILGFIDRFKRKTKTDVHLLCALDSKKYAFQDILILHKKNSYKYESLISHALAVFDKK